jgi:hypothetical protein
MNMELGVEKQAGDAYLRIINQHVALSSSNSDIT